ncbi:lysozyme [Bradyrhizobium sp. 62]|uniref:lysozyme n=1 Tax=Bradyrhizobium sp. 62 TaxID=1043588 RepID=UPI001FFBCE15|nr:lysozyme [Bradyrhizobium sp. 62]
MKTAHKAGAAGAGAIVLACAFIQPWEGLWTTAKVDTIGTGRPVTWCYGETEGPVKVGQKFTPKQCEDMLAAKLPRYNDEISRCIHVPISDKTRAAFISFAYNVGSAGFCRSSSARRLNAGDYRGACDGLMQWTRAQGKVVRGLVNRRTKERQLCLEGLTDVDVNRAAKADRGPVPAAHHYRWTDYVRNWWRIFVSKISL